MEVKSCRTCKRLFNYVSGPQICPACKDELEKKFYEVKEYIRENPKQGIKEIAEATGTTTQQLQQWVREERLEFSADSDIMLTCESCGAPIRTGRFCEKCKNNMANSMSALYEHKPEPKSEKKKSDGNHMRFQRS
ncbi:MAG: flagellar protein [Lachnospiraceae bacterium]|nr:flagellar protein [Lachnospiraceae bacterium]